MTTLVMKENKCEINRKVEENFLFTALRVHISSSSLPMRLFECRSWSPFLWSREET